VRARIVASDLVEASRTESTDGGQYLSCSSLVRDSRDTETM
jgi:hypothetical protein